MKILWLSLGLMFCGCDNYRNELDLQGKRIDSLQFQVERQACGCCQCDPCECSAGCSKGCCKPSMKLKPGERQPAIPKTRK